MTTNRHHHDPDPVLLSNTFEGIKVPTPSTTIEPWQTAQGAETEPQVRRRAWELGASFIQAVAALIAALTGLLALISTMR
ncbi:hypothetical protein ACFVQ0_21115 [Streptomyces sp. NPDC057900]|uniref:hypothetical protein n=1 Tax=Streptomyces sp. NPDC057900 TaxID=3346274 RepID=UPI0036EE0230